MPFGMDFFNPEYSGIWMPQNSGKSFVESIETSPVWNNPSVQAWSQSQYDPNFSGVVSSDDTAAALAAVIDPNGPTSGLGVGRRRSGGSRVQPINYIDAPIAERYGMNAQTAYNESLANTAHQREVQDLLKAGLNPVLSARYGGSSAPSTILVPNSGSGAHSGSGGYSSAKSLDGFTRLIKGVAPELVGLVVGQATSRSTGNSAKNITKGLLNALF